MATKRIRPRRRKLTPAQIQALRRDRKRRSQELAVTVLAQDLPAFDDLIWVAYVRPAEVLAHPSMALLSLTAPLQWMQLHYHVRSLPLQRRYFEACSKLTLYGSQKLTLAVLRHALPVFRAHGEEATTKTLIRLLEKLLRGETTRKRVLPEVLALGLTDRASDARIALLYASGCLLTPADRTEDQRYKAPGARRRRRKSRAWRILCGTYLIHPCLRMIIDLHARFNNDDMPQCPVAGLNELGWQAAAAEAIAAGKRVPRTWTSPPWT